jgi:hypothetical protein
MVLFGRRFPIYHTKSKRRKRKGGNYFLRETKKQSSRAQRYLGLQAIRGEALLAALFIKGDSHFFSEKSGCCYVTIFR